MKLYRLFYDDTTDLNGEKIEIGKTYTKENFDEEQLFSYFRLEDLYAEFDINKNEQNFKIYEVDLNNNINAFIKDYDGEDIFLSDVNGLSGDSLTILNEIDYSIFNNENVDKTYFVYAIKILKLKDEETIKYCLNENIDTLYNLLAMIDINVNINKLIKNRDYQTIETLIKKGKKESLDIFVNSDDSIIKGMVAQFGKEEYLNCLKNDNNIYVLCKVISRGRKEDIDYVLEKHPNNKEIILELINLKKDEYLPFILEKRNNFNIDFSIITAYGEKSFDNLLDSTNAIVVKKIINSNDESYLNYYIDSKDNSKNITDVKLYILKKYRRTDHAVKLLLDECEDVRKIAFEILHDDSPNLKKLQAALSNI